MNHERVGRVLEGLGFSGDDVSKLVALLIEYRSEGVLRARVPPHPPPGRILCPVDAATGCTDCRRLREADTRREDAGRRLLGFLDDPRGD